VDIICTAGEVMNEEADPELEAIRKRKMKQLQMFVEVEQEKKTWPSTPIPVTDMDFNDTMKRYPHVLVDFWAQWCAPCKMIGPVLEQMAIEFQGKAVIAKLDVDRNPRTASSFKVQSIPTLIFFKMGQPAERITGALPRNTLKNLIERNLH
jgi:thioredoxin 1